MKALPGIPAASRLPYLGAQILSGLGSSPTGLSERAVKRIKKSLPVPVEQEVLWADVVFGTRTHGLVLTEAGMFLKDGPSGDEDDDEDWSESEGAGYHYVKWRNFDPEVLYLEKGIPCIGGAAFRDAERFADVASQCARIVRSRNKAMQLGTIASRDEGVSFGPRCIAAFGKTAALTSKACLEILRDSSEDLPWVEVPSTQYDAVLQRLATAVRSGKADRLQNPDLVGALLRRSPFTYRQAMNIALTNRVPSIAFDHELETFSCTNPLGMSPALLSWLAGRSGVRGLDPDQAHGPKGVALEAFVAAGGMPASEPKTPEEAMMGMAATNAMYTAGRSVGAAGARVLVGALGVASGPLAAIASFTLGNMVGDAVPEAFNMAKSLFIEPAEKVYGRLFDGILRNVVFEHALTEAEQAVLGVFMRKIDPQVFRQLLVQLRDCTDQEQQIRDFIVPVVEAVRKR